MIYLGIKSSERTVRLRIVGIDAEVKRTRRIAPVVVAVAVIVDASRRCRRRRRCRRQPLEGDVSDDFVGPDFVVLELRRIRVVAGRDVIARVVAVAGLLHQEELPQLVVLLRQLGFEILKNKLKEK